MSLSPFRQSALLAFFFMMLQGQSSSRGDVSPTGVFNAKDFPNLAAAVGAASAAGGGSIEIPPGTYEIVNLVLSSKIRLQGVRGATVLKCIGASDGMVISQNYASDIAIQDLTIEADNPSCGKAIYFSNAKEGAGAVTISNVTISKSGNGFWAFGLWATFWESSDVFSFRVYQSAATAVHLENASNLVRFHGLDITGGSNANAAFQRGIELQDSEPQFFGGTVQGYFAASAIKTTGTTSYSSAAFYGFDVEGPNKNPADGAQIVVNGASNVSLFQIVGVPSLVITGVVRGCNLNGGNLGTVFFDERVEGCMASNGRAASITDRNGHNGWINEVGYSGQLYKTKIPAGFETPNAANATAE